MRTMRFIMIAGIVGLVMILSAAGIVAAQDEASARAWIGVSISDTDSGVLINDIAPDSPAATSGLEVDDVIVSINGESASTTSELIDVLSGFSPEDEVTLGILRDGEAMDIDITLGEFPEELVTVPGNNFARSINVLPMLGIVFDETDEGWQVTEVLPFAESNLEAGDIITAINGQEVGSLNIRELMSGMMQEEGATEVTVLRDGEEMIIEIEAMTMMGRTVTPVGGPVRLGVQYRALDEDFAANLGIDATEGALITNVLEDSPAAAAELMDGDIITAVNDTAIDGDNDLATAIGQFSDGDVVTLTVLRAGEEITLDVTPETQDVGRYGGPRIDIRPGGRGDGRGFGFRFDGEDFNFEDLEEFFGDMEGFDGVLPTDGTLSVTCQNADGDTVFSLSVSGENGFDVENFQLPDMGNRDFDFDSLDCQFSSDEVPAASDNGDL